VEALLKPVLMVYPGVPLDLLKHFEVSAHAGRSVGWPSKRTDTPCMLQANLVVLCHGLPLQALRLGLTCSSSRCGVGTTATGGSQPTCIAMQPEPAAGPVSTVRCLTVPSAITFNVCSPMGTT
jgi:hypothetical protein